MSSGDSHTSWTLNGYSFQAPPVPDKTHVLNLYSFPLTLSDQSESDHPLHGGQEIWLSIPLPLRSGCQEAGLQAKVIILIILFKDT